MDLLVENRPVVPIERNQAFWLLAMRVANSCALPSGQNDSFHSVSLSCAHFFVVFPSKFSLQVRPELLQDIRRSGLPFSVLSAAYSANGNGIVNGSGPQFASVVPKVP